MNQSEEHAQKLQRRKPDIIDEINESHKKKMVGKREEEKKSRKARKGIKMENVTSIQPMKKLYGGD